MRFWTYKDFNTKDWIVYDDKKVENVFHCDTEDEAKKSIKLLNLYHQRKANCCKCGCELEATPGFPLGSVFILDKDGNYYCMNCDGKFIDGDERIFEDWRQYKEIDMDKEKYKIKWNMTQKNLDILKSERECFKKGCEGNCTITQNYGCVECGAIRMEFMLTDNDGTPYVNVFFYGKNDGYGRLDNGVPYSYEDESLIVPIDCDLIDDFKMHFEKSLISEIKKLPEWEEYSQKPFGEWD